MNSKQRRKAYRAMPKPGMVITWKRPGYPTAAAGRGLVVGFMQLSTPEADVEWRDRPSVYRIRVRTAYGTHAHPLVSRIIAIEPGPRNPT